MDLYIYFICSGNLFHESWISSLLYVINVCSGWNFNHQPFESCFVLFVVSLFIVCKVECCVDKKIKLLYIPTLCNI